MIGQEHNRLTREWAWAYASKGLRLLPIRPRSSGNRVPLLRRCGQNWSEASAVWPVLEWWFERWPDMRLGLPLQLNGLLALDIDSRHGGHETLAALEQQLGPLPSTVEQRTPSGGRHILFWDPQCRVRGSLGSGVEIKSRHWILIAPSAHQTVDGCYSWLRGQSPLERLPEPLPWAWLQAAAQPQGQPNAAKGALTAAGQQPSWSTEYGDNFGTKVAWSAFERVCNAPCGTRMKTLNREGYGCGKAIARGRMSEGKARELLEVAARACGLAEDFESSANPYEMVLRTINEAIAAGKRAAEEDARSTRAHV